MKALTLALGLACITSAAAITIPINLGEARTVRGWNELRINFSELEGIETLGQTISVDVVFNLPLRLWPDNEYQFSLFAVVPLTPNSWTFGSGRFSIDTVAHEWRTLDEGAHFDLKLPNLPGHNVSTGFFLFYPDLSRENPRHFQDARAYAVGPHVPDGGSGLAMLGIGLAGISYGIARIKNGKRDETLEEIHGFSR